MNESFIEKILNNSDFISLASKNDIDQIKNILNQIHQHINLQNIIPKITCSSNNQNAIVLDWDKIVISHFDSISRIFISPKLINNYTGYFKELSFDNPDYLNYIIPPLRKLHNF